MANAIQLPLALKWLILARYRVHRTTDYLEIYAPVDGPRWGKLIQPPKGEESIGRLYCDHGYFSDTFYGFVGEQEIISTNSVYDELITGTSVGGWLKLLYDALNNDEWTPTQGWQPSKQGDQCQTWSETIKRLNKQEWMTS